MPPRLLIVAGEASGDAHSGRLIQSLRNLRPEMEFQALGGQQMKAAGAELLIPLTDRAVTGFVEVLGNLKFFKQALSRTAQILDQNRFAGVILVDNPGFNFRVARLAHQRNIPVIYYISPQIWAWHKSRIHEMKKWLKKILVIFPFEVELFENAGIDVEFVGNPLIEALDHIEDPSLMKRNLGYDDQAPLIALLPGSRKVEIHRMLSLFVDSAALISKKIPEARFFLPLAETLDRSILGQLPDLPAIQVIEHPTYSHRAMADFAITASGTATLENALLGIPTAIVYKCSWISYFLARALIQVKHIGMANILAGETVCEEFIQHHATPQALADYTCDILNTPERHQAIRSQLANIRKKLGGPGASRRAAEAILQTLNL